jgi:hypothetical protein
VYVASCHVAVSADMAVEISLEKFYHEGFGWQGEDSVYIGANMM